MKPNGRPTSQRVDAVLSKKTKVKTEACDCLGLVVSGEKVVIIAERRGGT